MNDNQMLRLVQSKFRKLGYDPRLVALVDAQFPYCAALVRMTSGTMDRQFKDLFELFIPTRSLDLAEVSGHLSRRSFIYRRGMLAFSPPGADWTISWTGVIEGVSILVSPVSMARAVSELYAEDSSEVDWRLALSDNAPTIAYLGLDLLSQSSTGYPAGKPHHDTLVKALFSMIIRRYAKTEMRDTASVGIMSRAVLAAMQFIEQNLNKGIDVDLICQMSASSPAQLNRQFRQELGMSVWSYVLARRLRKGRDLMLDGGMSMEQIAREAGFSSGSNFARAYRTRGLHADQ